MADLRGYPVRATNSLRIRPFSLRLARRYLAANSPQAPVYSWESLVPLVNFSNRNFEEPMTPSVTLSMRQSVVLTVVDCGVILEQPVAQGGGPRNQEFLWS